MKANGAPEKIYLEAIYPDNGVLPNGLNYTPSPTDIEYTRTDTFIKKALKFLDENFFFNNLHITLCKDCHKNYHFIPLGLRECDKHIPDCGWEGFSIERLKKQGFHVNGNHAMLKLNGFTLFLTHQGDGENTAVATLFKDGSQKRYHEDVVTTHLMLDDYLEEYLDFDFSTL